VNGKSRGWFAWLALGLLVLIVALQLRLWTGEGGMPEVWRIRARVDAQRAENDTLRERNAALEADVQDLKTGREAVEERARSELGMVKDGETFYQVVEPTAPQPDEPGGGEENPL
jgi:cell division protein FtsB